MTAASMTGRKRWLWLGTIALAAAVALPAAFVLGQDTTDVAGAIVTVDANGGDVRAAGASVTVRGTAANIRGAGAQVDISADAAGTIWAVGARISVSNAAGGDVKAAGASVAVTARVRGDVEVAGAVVSLNNTVGGDARIGGASVTIGPETSIGGSLNAGGANVIMQGHIYGPGKLAGAAVTFDGQADSTLTLAGEHIVIGSNARVGGDLTIYSRQEPTIEAGATFGGAVDRVAPPSWWSSMTGWMWAAALAVAVAVGTVVAGVVLMLFGGRLFTTATDHARLRPVSSFLIGLATVVLIPAIAAILMATIVGLSVGLALLLALPLLVVFGHAVAAAGIAAGIFVRTAGDIAIGRAILMLVVGAVIVVLIGLIPWVGPLAVAIILVLGVGAVTRTIGTRLRTVGQAPAVPAAT